MCIAGIPIVARVCMYGTLPSPTYQYLSDLMPIIPLDPRVRIQRDGNGVCNSCNNTPMCGARCPSQKERVDVIPTRGGPHHPISSFSHLTDRLASYMPCPALPTTYIHMCIFLLTTPPPSPLPTIRRKRSQAGSHITHGNARRSDSALHYQ